jgi:hypothetical protein
MVGNCRRSVPDPGLPTEARGAPFERSSSSARPYPSLADAKERIAILEDENKKDQKTSVDEGPLSPQDQLRLEEVRAQRAQAEQRSRELDAESLKLQS